MYLKKQASFLNLRNFQSKNFLAIYKKLRFWYIILRENAIIKLHDRNYQR